MDSQKIHNLHDLRHSCAHLLAAAVMELWPDTKRTIGPAIENGFYYDFEFSHPISESNLPAIEQKMHEIVKTWNSFERKELTKNEALQLFHGNPYKQELIEEFAKENQTLTAYTSGSYIDLCKGGHIDNPKEQLAHFKLLSVAGAYWRGNAKNTMLTRIYGTCFPTKEELEKHLWQMEEAKKRDHRKLGQELELFTFDDLAGPGLPLWLPKGTIIRDEIEKLAKKTEFQWGYQRVATPHVAKKELFETSGHLPYYKDTMYPAMKLDDGEYYLKAMNCPHTHLIYRHKPRSYRDLPLRFAEYGTVYRYELSGTLAGLLRVRGMSMNDAHIYCTKDQIKEEFKKVMDLHRYYYHLFGIRDFRMRLSLHDPAKKEKYVDDPELWEFSEQAIREAMRESGLPFEEGIGEAAFYGPKIDFLITSVVGREETISTNQLDFTASKRFNLSYVGSDGAEKPVFVIHRAPLGTHERFIAFLIEHYAGSFPVWLSPVQAVVLPISDKHHAFAQNVFNILQKQGFRVELNAENKTVGGKIRQSTLQKIPYMLIIGDKEIEKSSENEFFASVRTREGIDKGAMSISEFMKVLNDHIEIYS